MAPTLRGREEDCEGLEPEAAIAETAQVLARASEVWSRWACPASGRCCHLATTGRSPWLWPSEWWVIEAALAKAGRPPPPARADGACRLLDPEGRRCTLYSARPFGCRTYFCERGRGPPLEGRATHQLLDELTQLNIAVDPQARPRPIDEWWADARLAPPGRE